MSEVAAVVRRLPALTDRPRCAKQKWEMNDRVVDKDAARRDRDRLWEACKKKVDLRDKHRCRICKRKTKKTLTLCAEREEHCHLVRRKKEEALMWDSRNVFTGCHACHRKFDTHQIHAVQKASLMFVGPNGKSFINADEPIEWKEAA